MKTKAFYHRKLGIKKGHLSMTSFELTLTVEIKNQLVQELRDIFDFLKLLGTNLNLNI